jgi:hypothetical protein
MKRENSMSILRNSLSLFILLTLNNPSFAQAVSKDLQKHCAAEQVAEHKGVKGKALTEEDFLAYCSCQSEFISKNATNAQINELLMNPKAKPDWLKTLESKAMKSCLSENSTMRT